MFENAPVQPENVMKCWDETSEMLQYQLHLYMKVMHGTDKFPVLKIEEKLPKVGDQIYNIVKLLAGD